MRISRAIRNKLDKILPFKFIANESIRKFFYSLPKPDKLITMDFLVENMKYLHKNYVKIVLENSNLTYCLFIRNHKKINPNLTFNN